MAPGTTLDDPVTQEHLPDLGTSIFEITEYLENQQAYDLFDYMLRDLLVAQPQDPLQHLIDCLQVPVPSGPLQIFVCSAPAVGRSKFCKDLAKKLGLTYISAGELLRDSLGADTKKADLATDAEVSGVVLEAVKQAKSMMQGFVLDGFPRTRIQTTILQEHAIVPTHVLVLKARMDQILERQAMIRDGGLQGDLMDPQVLQTKLNLYTCHGSAALESYANKIKVIDAFAPPEFVASEMERTVRMLPRSKGPGGPPRVLITGPRGSGVREHASRLASLLGAVFVDGQQLQSTGLRREPTAPLSPRSPQGGGAGYAARYPTSPTRMVTSMDLPEEKLNRTSSSDALGCVGVRLRQPDCKSRGYVLCGFVDSAETAQVLSEDMYLRPTRIIALRANVSVCLARLRHFAVDKVTGKIWTTRPKNENMRKRLVKKQDDMPAAITAACEAYEASLPGILEIFGKDGRCMEFDADGDPENVYSDIVEFVERPLPLGSSGK